MGKAYAAGTFKFFETYNVVAFLCLFLAITLSMLVQVIEEGCRLFRLHARPLRP